MEGKVRIKLKVEDLDYGTSTKIDKVIQLYPDLGWECEFIGEFSSVLNKFMSLLGYYYNKDRVFLESVSDDEYDYLIGKLDEYRSKEDKNE
mgnify:FL=1